MRYSVGTNIPGYLPDNIPSIHETWDAAKRRLISDMLWIADHTDSEDEAMELTAAAEDVNFCSPRYFDVTIGDYVWWIAPAAGEDTYD